MSNLSLPCPSALPQSRRPSAISEIRTPSTFPPDAVVPNAREGAVHDLKTMSGSWPKAGIAAIRLNSDIVTAPSSTASRAG
jgi:hypothetical protein